MNLKNAINLFKFNVPTITAIVEELLQLEKPQLTTSTVNVLNFFTLTTLVPVHMYVRKQTLQKTTGRKIHQSNCNNHDIKYR